MTMESNAEVKHDPGWNDPPLLTYEEATSIRASTNKRGISYKKRVAYPVTGKTADAALDFKAKPASSPMEIPPIISSGSLKDNNDNVHVNNTLKLSKREKLNKALQNLQTFAPFHDSNINKRIKIMEKMWIDDKLDESVQSKVLELTEALCKGDVELADHIQIGLMVDHVSQCNSWMSGIRHLINYKRNAKEFES